MQGLIQTTIPDRYAALAIETIKRIAAKIGQFSFMAQLGHPSSHAQAAGKRKSLITDIKAVIQAAQPEIIYTHNPFDKHATHIGVMLATLAAIRELPEKERPQKLFGCEVWRALDWLPDSEKTIHDVSAHPDTFAFTFTCTR